MLRTRMVVAAILAMASWASGTSIVIVSQSANVFAGMDGSLGHVEDSASTAGIGDFDLLATATFSDRPPVTQRSDAGAKRTADALGDALSAVLLSSFSTGGSGESEVTEAVSLPFMKIEFDYAPQKKPTKLKLTTSGGGILPTGTFSGGFNVKLTGPSDEVILSESYSVDEANPIVLDEVRTLPPGRYVLEMTGDWTAGPDTVVARSTEFSLVAVPLPAAALPGLCLGITVYVGQILRRRKSAQ